VDDVSFAIGRGECVGLVGESGCGKSTLSRLITRLLEPTQGRITFDGRDLREVAVKDFARSPLRSRIQQVFQDPTDSLNPRLSAFAAIADPLRRATDLRGSGLARRVEELAEQVSLPRELLTRFPHQLSGGQKARVGIARAISLEPSLLVLDEPTAALDVSVQAVILQLLDELRARLGMTYLFVTHDLSLVRLICDRMIVMYLGRVVEAAPVETMFAGPAHPYTRALLSAIPDLRAGDGLAAERLRLPGEPRSPIDLPRHACALAGRCPDEAPVCRSERPALLTLSGAARAARDRHEVACHLAQPSAGTSPGSHDAVPTLNVRTSVPPREGRRRST
jgi:oligopeptide/dipeptide ABC transporter ATP-binding protein